VRTAELLNIYGIDSSGVTKITTVEATIVLKQIRAVPPSSLVEAAMYGMQKA
jgi:hypothetical protein